MSKHAKTMRRSKAVMLLAKEAVKRNNIEKGRPQRNDHEPTATPINEALFFALVDQIGSERAEEILRSGSDSNTDLLSFMSDLGSWNMMRMHRAGLADIMMLPDGHSCLLMKDGWTIKLKPGTSKIILESHEEIKR